MELERLRKGATYPAPVFLPPSMRPLQFPAPLQPHSCTFIPFSTFIYLFSNSHIDEKQGCAFTERAGLLWWDMFGQLFLIERAPVGDWTLSDERCSSALYLIFKENLFIFI